MRVEQVENRLKNWGCGILHTILHTIRRVCLSRDASTNEPTMGRLTENKRTKK